MDADNMMRFPPHYHEGKMLSLRLSDHAIRGDEDQPKKWKADDKKTPNLVASPKGSAPRRPKATLR